MRKEMCMSIVCVLLVLRQIENVKLQFSFKVAQATRREPKLTCLKKNRSETESENRFELITNLRSMRAIKNF